MRIYEKERLSVVGTLEKQKPLLRLWRRKTKLKIIRANSIQVENGSLYSRTYPDTSAVIQIQVPEKFQCSSAKTKHINFVSSELSLALQNTICSDKILIIVVIRFFLLCAQRKVCTGASHKA